MRAAIFLNFLILSLCTGDTTELSKSVQLTSNIELQYDFTLEENYVHFVVKTDNDGNLFIHRLHSHRTG
jgi:hypothetical protein